jgi:pyruvate formate lyase activating enzyme
MPDGRGRPPAPALRVGGLVPFSTTDWPGRLAAVLFLQGCPWRCGYCHNPHLVGTRAGHHEHHWNATLAWLATRSGLLDAVVFSGGEPTLHRGLGDGLRAVREQGFAVGLHTGGAYPRRLAEVLPDVDWIGLDIKAPGDHYAAVTGVRSSGAAAFASLDLVLQSGVAVEVRTTVHPALTPPSSLLELGRELAAHGVARWVLQAFRPQGCASDALNAAAPQGACIDAVLVSELRGAVPDIVLR